MKLAFLVFIPLMAAGPELSSLGWMSGCWAAEHKGARIEEHWSKPAGDLMLDYSRTMRPGHPVFFEQLRIELKNGELTYIPLIGKQGPIPFTL